ATRPGSMRASRRMRPAGARVGGIPHRRRGSSVRFAAPTSLRLGCAPSGRARSHAMKTSLFDALGGARSIRAVVDDFYVRVLADRALAPFFAEVDLDAQRAHLAAFVGVAL